MQRAEGFEAFHLKPWQNDATFAELLKSFERILVLPLASMPQNVRKRGKRVSQSVGAP